MPEVITLTKVVTTEVRYRKWHIAWQHDRIQPLTYDVISGVGCPFLIYYQLSNYRPINPDLLITSVLTILSILNNLPTVIITTKTALL